MSAIEKCHVHLCFSLIHVWTTKLLTLSVCAVGLICCFLPCIFSRKLSCFRKLPNGLQSQNKEVCLFVKDLDKSDREYEKSVRHFKDFLKSKGISCVSEVRVACFLICVTLAARHLKVCLEQVNVCHIWCKGILVRCMCVCVFDCVCIYVFVFLCVYVSVCKCLWLCV